MKKRLTNLLIITLSAIALLNLSCKQQTNTVMKDVLIVPNPVSLEQTKGSFRLDNKASISSSAELSAVAKLFALQIKAASGIEIPVVQDENKSIILKIDENITQEEGYTLNITSTEVIIAGKTTTGIFYGTQTFLQLLPPDRKAVTSTELPCLSITDYPNFKWRGMHLDESRHFFGKDLVKSMIDQMANLKMNVFHWHLIDDQGWRIEIKKYPKLTEIGAWRLDNENGKWNYSVVQPKEGEPKYGGFYTQEEIKEIVAYAAERAITIVPEVEMPGHATSMIWAYPELSCKGKLWNMDEGEAFEFSDPLCAGNELTFEMIENVLAEVIELFPSKYIHIGGDECKKDPWGECAKCQKRMKNENLSTLEELQSYFIKRVEKFVVSKGRRIIGWDEILEGGLAPEAGVMSWRGYVGGIEAAEQGHEVVMTPTSFCYFDYYQGNNAEEPHAIGGFLPLSKVYEFDPIPEELEANKHHLILGGQANVWTEHMFTAEQVEYMVFPRLFAMAEVLWTPKEKLNYSNFLERINPRYVSLAAQGINFRMPMAEGLGEKIIFDGDTLISLFNPYTDKSAEIRYTLDGTNPDENSEIYTKPIKITETTCLKARVFYKGIGSNISMSWFYKIDAEKNGLTCEQFNGEWTMLPDFSTLTPVKTAKVNTISEKALETKADDYALRFTGKLEITETKEYTFYTSSDDGSRLIINGEQIINNDGTHGANLVTATLKLEAGMHDLEILYFEGKGGEFLEVGTLNGEERIPLDPSKLFF